MAGSVSSIQIDQDQIDLQNRLRGALSEIGIYEPTDSVMNLLSRAALLSPDDNRPPISTTRLFVGALEHGETVMNEDVNPDQSYGVS